MTDENVTAWKCPKDGTVTQPLGRRSGAWRCPTCRGVFIDTGARPQGRPPWWAPVLTSLAISLLARFVARRLGRRPNSGSSF